jgi:hypothetical protein
MPVEDQRKKVKNAKIQTLEDLVRLSGNPRRRILIFLIMLSESGFISCASRVKKKTSANFSVILLHIVR